MMVSVEDARKTRGNPGLRSLIADRSRPRDRTYARKQVDEELKNLAVPPWLPPFFTFADFVHQFGGQVLLERQSCLHSHGSMSYLLQKREENLFSIISLGAGELDYALTNEHQFEFFTYNLALTIEWRKPSDLLIWLFHQARNIGFDQNFAEDVIRHLCPISPV